MGLSLWQRGSGAGSRTCDVCVVGGGISGICAALELERAGAGVVLLEAHRVASGASGRNAGYLMRGAASCYAVMAREHGREVAREVWRWTEDNLARLIEHGIEMTDGFVRRPSCLVAVDEDEERDLRASAALLAGDGFDAELIEPGDGPDDALWRSATARVGLLNPGDAACDPVRVVEHLRSRFGKTRILEGAEAWSIEEDGGRVAVRSSVGEVVADQVLVCTNAWAGRLVPSLGGFVTPNRAQMLAAEYDGAPGEELLRWLYYINRGHDYLRPGPGGLVLFGGGRDAHEAAERGFGIEPTEGVQATLERRLAAYLGDGYRVVHRWAGTMGFSPDGLPIVGRVPDAPGCVWVCCGFTGHGMSMACLAGEHVARAMMEREGRSPDWLAPGRFGELAQK